MSGRVNPCCSQYTIDWSEAFPVCWSNEVISGLHVKPSMPPPSLHGHRALYEQTSVINCLYIVHRWARRSHNDKEGFLFFSFCVEGWYIECSWQGWNRSLLHCGEWMQITKITSGEMNLTSWLLWIICKGLKQWI